jgi:hypothetical protein
VFLAGKERRDLSNQPQIALQSINFRQLVTALDFDRQIYKIWIFYEVRRQMTEFEIQDARLPYRMTSIRSPLWNIFTGTKKVQSCKNTARLNFDMIGICSCYKLHLCLLIKSQNVTNFFVPFWECLIRQKINKFTDEITIEEWKSCQDFGEFAEIKNKLKAKRKHMLWRSQWWNIK